MHENTSYLYRKSQNYQCNYKLQVFRLQVTSGSDHITDVIVNLILKIWADSANSASDFPSFKDLSCLKSVKLLMSAC